MCLAQVGHFAHGGHCSVIDLVGLPFKLGVDQMAKGVSARLVFCLSRKLLSFAPRTGFKLAKLRAGEDGSGLDQAVLMR